VLVVTNCKKAKFNQDPDLIIDAQTNEASLKSSTSESVQLAYNLNNGKSVTNQIETIMELEVEGKNIPMTYYSEGNYKVTGKGNNETSELTYKITRMKIHSADQNIDFDSENSKDTTNKETAEFIKKILNVPAIFQINKGKILSQNIDSFAEVFGMQFPYIQELIDQQLNNFATSSFFPTSEGEIKAGDIISNTDTVELSIQGIPVKTFTSYQVKMISKDKKKVLVEPKGTIFFNLGELPEEGSITMNQGLINGYLLFDMEKGHVTQSNIIATIDFTSEYNGEKSNVILRSTTNMVVE